jgi:hypothetical protein
MDIAGSKTVAKSGDFFNCILISDSTKQLRLLALDFYEVIFALGFALFDA